MAPNKDTSTCLACGKKLGSGYSVQCAVCGLWIHKTCGNISDEGLRFLEEQMKNTGKAWWACRSCTAYACGMNHRMQEIEKKLEDVQKSCSDNESGLKKVTEEVNKLVAKVKEQSVLVEKAAMSSNEGVFEELREREARRNNVVLHGMREAGDDTTGMDRRDWDIRNCENMFRALRTNVTAENIKFCRRVGERGAAIRPLVVGFYDERDKRVILKSDTRRTVFSDVEIGPDLTKKQRQEEADLRKEAAKKNGQLSDEDRAKNLAWLVVGPRGEKRMVKKFVNVEEELRDRNRRQKNGGSTGNRGTDSNRTRRTNHSLRTPHSEVIEADREEDGQGERQTRGGGRRKEREDQNGIPAANR